jgi:hypothetical protein
MTKQEYDKTGFFFGIKAKVNETWYPVLTTDFETRETTCLIDGKEKTFHVEAIQEFETLKK